ncbi:Gfo/Idh/MocA family oxidoreductase [bacterium]|nr:Gfo/Idh/MocA family oxidoreductase [bacterium]
MNITFIGAGAMTEKHIRIIKNLGLPVTLSIASRDYQKAKNFRDKFSLDSFYASYDEAINSPKSDVLVIATPPAFHAELIKKGMAFKKHLIVEKPVFQSFTELKELGEAMLQYNNFIAVAENQHYNAFQQKIKRKLLDKRWGRPIAIEVTRFGVQKRLGWRQDSGQMPLGALHEGGVHWIHRLLDLTAVFEENPFQSVSSVHAFKPQKPLSITPFEDTVYAVSHHRSGLVGRLFHSWGLKRRLFSNVCRVVMEKGNFVFHADNLWGFSNGTQTRILKPHIKDGSGYGAMWKNFVASIDKGEKPLLKLEQIFYDFCYMDACYRSIASALPVSLDVPSFLGKSSSG